MSKADIKKQAIKANIKAKGEDLESQEEEVKRALQLKNNVQ